MLEHALRSCSAFAIASSLSWDCGARTAKRQRNIEKIHLRIVIAAGFENHPVSRCSLTCNVLSLLRKS